ncbi:competence type IV pilus ATPase ComGA [Virgibacillus sediminis]|uniref:Competence type IV pilus ATPase ComGA n=1 Tax=Virgibacillus sediminis TaxID=202260 RepID=A0ABV7A5Z4_9BACI
MNHAANLSDKLLNSALEAQASDIHFYPFADHTNIYFRILGKRRLHQKLLNSQYHLLLTYYKFTAGMDIGETRRPQNGAMAHKDAGSLYFLRLSTLPVNGTESLAIRILPQQDKLPLDQLFLFPSQLSRIKSWISNRTGLILFTGPTGSGKTTTLYALLQTILKEKSYQTITLEDPIEKDIDDILQVQINEKAGITYQTGMKAALRHDPDILMVGEIRDNQTAEFAFEASLTGHLVLSTLHAKNAAGTLQRLKEMGLTEGDLRQSLIAVAALELLPLQLEKISNRRAAVLELLEGRLLEQTINGKDISKLNRFHSFEYLRKKAYAYGFVSQDIFQGR